MNLSLLLGLVVASHASTGLVTFDGHVADGSLAATLVMSGQGPARDDQRLRPVCMEREHDAA